MSNISWDLSDPSDNNNKNGHEKFPSKNLGIPQSLRSSNRLSSPPRFYKSNRDFKPFPEEIIELPPIPPEIKPQRQSLLSIILPIVGTGIGITFMALFSKTGYSSYIFISLSMVLVSASLGVVNYVQRKKEAANQKAERESGYQQLLSDFGNRLRIIREQFVEANKTPNPIPSVCAQRVLEAKNQGSRSRLWERSVGDTDFLQLRVGEGTLKFPNLKIKEQTTNSRDSLYKTHKSLVDLYSNVPNSSVCINLRELRSVGITGLRDDVQSQINSILIQIATHHSPDEVRLVVFFPEQEKNKWDWIKWLPHTWNEDRTTRYIGDTDKSKKALAELFVEKLTYRWNQADPVNSQGPIVPVYIFVFTDDEFWNGQNSVLYQPLHTMISQKGDSLGAFGFYIPKEENHLPAWCNVKLHLDNSQNAALTVHPNRQDRLDIPFIPDRTPKETSDQFARSMASIQYTGVYRQGGQIPEKITMLEMLKIENIEDIKILDNWKSNLPFKAPYLSVPIGVSTDNKSLFLNIHERGHGPNGMMAGAPGSGKSELLQTLVGSLALHFAPNYINFIFIDLTGLLAEPFRELPHQVGIIDNLDGKLADRAISGLDSELKRRKKIFEDFGVLNIDQYQERNYKNPKNPIVPHLLIVVDEFAELALRKDTFVPRLLSMARSGRKYGIHVLLANQKLENVIPEQFYSLLRYRLCLRVETPSDSKFVIGRVDAAGILERNRGRTFMKYGLNDLFEFQSAWGGAEYAPADPNQSHQAIFQINLDGSRSLLSVNPGLKPLTVDDDQTENRTQLSALMSEITKVAKENGYTAPKGPWIPPLEKQLWLEDIRQPETGWNNENKTWTSEPADIAPIIGQYDDIHNQRIEALKIDLNKNTVIYGADIYELSAFVETLLISAAMDHAPEKIEYAVLDFTGGSLKNLEGFPHCSGIVFPDDPLRIYRAFNYLVTLLDQRKTEGQSSPNRKDVIFVINNLDRFFENYAKTTNQNEIRQFRRLVLEGTPYQIHTLVTTTSVISFQNSDLSLSFKTYALFDLQNENQYQFLGIRGLRPESDTRGRGIIEIGSGLYEFQTAIFNKEAISEIDRQSSIINLAQSMKKVSESSLDIVHISETPQEVFPGFIERNANEKYRSVENTITIGKDISSVSLDDLSVNIHDNPNFWVAGDAVEGRAMLLKTITTEISSHFNERVQFLFFDLGGSDIFSKYRENTFLYIDKTEELQTVNLQKIINEIRSTNAKKPENDSIIFLMVDDYNLFKQLNKESAEYLAKEINNKSHIGFHTFFAGRPQDFSVPSFILNDKIKQFNSGIVVGGYEKTALEVNLGISFTIDQSILIPKGVPYFIRRGKKPIPLYLFYEE